MIINSFYNFNLNSRKPSELSYTVERISKVGNNDILNLFFENYEEVEVNKLGPIEALNGYIAYTIKTLGRSLVNNPIIFETSASLKDYGIVKTLKKSDAMLFRILDSDIFEVYVFNGRYSSQVLLLQMLKDGSLNTAIESIKAKIA
ncbi:hypothetical protein HDF26_003599 [Pedobacter cryoconitis]|uniref:hypothetical protein n=1 Tax=Pedobacter cryoconitis TaxID=188932 RepID=UPI001618B389|nr:hypothetical protein [Pedobacter cryoconitis]MBB6273139.1 hypothetical protein [Pedobacter cryoconitis]